MAHVLRGHGVTTVKLAGIGVKAIVNRAEVGQCVVLAEQPIDIGLVLWRIANKLPFLYSLKVLNEVGGYLKFLFAIESW